MEKKIGCWKLFSSSRPNNNQTRGKPKHIIKANSGVHKLNHLVH